MTKKELKAFCELLMCSDPWPTHSRGNQRTLKNFANHKAQSQGFDDWIDAYHQLHFAGRFERTKK